MPLMFAMPPVFAAQAGLETRDTADLEVCATQSGRFMATIHVRILEVFSLHEPGGQSVCINESFGQVEIMNRNDHGNTHWFRLINLFRNYAAKHARRHMVLCNGHLPTGGLMRDGNPILDFHAFPLRVKETPEKLQEAILQAGFTDGIYSRSKGGKSFSG